LADAQQRQQLGFQQSLQNAQLAQNQAQFGAGLQQQVGLANQQAGLSGQQANQQAMLQALMGGGQLAGQQQGLQQAGALGQLGSLSGLNQLGLSPYGAQFAPLQGLGAILGDPTVLQNAFGQSQSQSTQSSQTTDSGLGGLLGGAGALFGGLARFMNPGVGIAMGAAGAG
jgi:hypothetical protein